MVKTYKKKQTRRRRQRQHKRASVRHGRVRRLRKIQRGGDGTVDAMVNGITITNYDNATLTVDKITTNNVNRISPASFTIDNKKIDFFIAEPPGGQGLTQRFVYIFLDDKPYGRIMLVINGTKYNDSYDKSVATAIFNAINNKRDFQQYKTN